MDYPAHRLARPAAPAYRGEGAHALWHYSEDPTLSVFEPHVPATRPELPPRVWAVDTRHAPMFWFPRDCPRGCVWLTSETSDADRQRFFGHSAASVQRMHVIEARWLARLRSCQLFAYLLPEDGFEPDAEVGGYWHSAARVVARERTEVSDLLASHAEAGIELRVTESLWPWWDEVARSTLGFSGSRLRK